MEKTLQEELKTLEDKRRKQGQRNSIDIVLMITIMATMSGFVGYRAISDFVNRYKKELMSYFKPKKGMLPSYSTVRRVLIKIEEDKFALIFERWMSKYIKSSDNNWVSVDSKAIRGSCQKEEDKKLAHLVSFFINDSKEVILSKKTESKSNEIPLVQEMLKKFPLKDLIITMDAMHCQEETLKLVKKSGNDYVIQVKKNQKNLFKQIEFNTTVSEPHRYMYKTSEPNRGRWEEREVLVYDDLYEIDNNKWANVFRRHNYNNIAQAIRLIGGDIKQLSKFSVVLMF